MSVEAGDGQSANLSLFYIMLAVIYHLLERTHMQPSIMFCEHTEVLSE